MSICKFRASILSTLKSVSVFSAAMVSLAMISTTAVSPAMAQPVSDLFASQGEVPIIQSIAVTGNQRIEGETIGSYLVVAPGDRADPQLLDLGVKTLFNTGLFSDVSLSMQAGGVLLIEIKENPIVNQVVLDGNKRVKEDKITEEVQLAPRSIFTRSKVCLLYTSPSPRDQRGSRMPSSA